MGPSSKLMSIFWVIRKPPLAMGSLHQGSSHLYGGFLKLWYPTTMGFPTKNDQFVVLWWYHHLRKHPYTSKKNEGVQQALKLIGTCNRLPKSSIFEAQKTECPKLLSQRGDRFQILWPEKRMFPQVTFKVKYLEDHPRTRIRG